MALSTIPEASNRELDYNLDTNLNPELKAFLEHGLQSDEAQALTEVFNANVGEILNVSKENLILLREALGTTDKTTAAITDSEKRIIADIANGVTTEVESPVIEDAKEISDFSEPLYSVGTEIEEDAQDQYIQSVRDRENQFDEYDVDFEEMNDESFDAYMNSFGDKLSQLGIDTNGDIEKQARNIPSILMQIQFKTGSKPDGVDGPGTQTGIDNYIIQTAGVDSFEDILLDGIEHFEFDKAAATTTVDNLREGFHENYGPLSNYIETSLGLPSSSMPALSRKESNYGSEMNSNTGSKGMTMLTMWPFRDMRGMASGRKIEGEDMPKVKEYQALFARYNISNLKELPYGKDGKIEDTLPSIVWEKLETVQTCSPEEAIVIFRQIEGFIKAPTNKDKYANTLNMLCGGVYLTYCHENRSGGDFEETLRLYNNDTKVAYTDKDGNEVQVRDDYASKILRYMKTEEEYKNNNKPFDNNNEPSFGPEDLLVS